MCSVRCSSDCFPRDNSTFNSHQACVYEGCYSSPFHYNGSPNKISANNLVGVVIGYSQMIVLSNTVISDRMPAQPATYS